MPMLICQGLPTSSIDYIDKTYPSNDVAEAHRNMDIAFNEWGTDLKHYYSPNQATGIDIVGMNRNIPIPQYLGKITSWRLRQIS